MSRATELRDSFDRGFAAAQKPVQTGAIELLAIRVAGQSFAVVLSEVAALHRDLQLCVLPSPARELLGVAAVRGVLLPVCDLRVVLDLAVDAPPRWCIAIRGASLAVAFDGYDGPRRIDHLPPESPDGGLARRVIVDRGHSIPVLDLVAVAKSVAERWPKES